jgi:hypothetical protein
MKPKYAYESDLQRLTWGTMFQGESTFSSEPDPQMSVPCRTVSDSYVDSIYAGAIPLKLETDKLRTLTVRDLIEYAVRSEVMPSELLAGPEPLRAASAREG